MISDPPTPTRRQPRRSARDRRAAAKKAPSLSHSLKHSSDAGVPKKARHAKGGKKKAIRDLEKRVAAMEPQVALSEQSELLKIPTATLVVDVLPDAPPPTPAPATPKSAKNKRGRPKKKRDEDMYMDEFLLSDEEEPAPQVAAGGQTAAAAAAAAAKNLRRGDRWIPELEHRRRITKKPANVPHGLWMSYRFFDDYMYRMSLTEEEVLSHPLMDEVFSFQNNGHRPPVAPEGFWWEGKELVPVRYE
ncbi:hypothetical protein F4821DRAFT_279083 [Hypoxylon rubiginosum]|uniref:Uncharacterized protein n=1 Tax=Hypoxylon rubiginosum TaxID=110542 RepID=A0ACC0CZK9_9PEZI|nr:hypothetical protein F4821DRAFT_279083 [Hypoxylon rubiginosum]